MKRALRAKKKGSSKKKRRRDKRNGDGVEEISIRVKRRLNIASPKVKCNREELKQCVLLLSFLDNLIKRKVFR